MTANVMTSPPESAWLTGVLRGDSRAWPFAEDAASIQRVIDVAQSEGIASLCFDVLAGRVDLPAGFVAALRADAKQQAALELSREIELQRILALFDAAGLHPLLMKGAALAYTLYPSPHHRSRCDNDLLFPGRPTADRAWALLQQSGYHRNNAVSGEFISQEFACYRTDAFGVAHALDIHWKPSNEVVFADTLSFQELDAAAQPVAVLGPNARALAPVHALLLACMHRMQHAAEGQSHRLIWLYDIHLLVAALNDDEWTAFLNLAADRKLCSLCRDGLSVAEQRFGVRAPPGVFDALARGSNGEWLTPECFASARSSSLSGLRALPDWRSRRRWLQEHLFPDARYMLEKYRTRRIWLLPLLYLHRILNGLRKH